MKILDIGEHPTLGSRVMAKNLHKRLAPWRLSSYTDFTGQARLNPGDGNIFRVFMLSFVRTVHSAHDRFAVQILRLPFTLKSTLSEEII